MCSESEPAPTSESQQAKATENEDSLTFHESWSEQQRADLLRMYCMLRIDVPATAADSAALMESMVNMVADHMADNFSEWDEAEFERLYQAERKKYPPEFTLFCQTVIEPWLKLLRETAATGRGDVYGKDGASLAWLAVRLCMPDMVKELVRRGADPNQKYIPPAMEGARISIQEDLLSTIVMHSPLCQSADMSPQVRKELVDWLLANGADPNKSHAPTLLSYCSWGVGLHRSTLCAEPILLKLESIEPAAQKELAVHLLRYVPDNGALFEKLHNKGLLQLQNMHLYGNILSDLGNMLSDTETTPDISQKMHLLLTLGINPNAMPEVLSQNDFESEEAFEEYTDQFEEYPPEHPLRSIFYSLLDNEDANGDLPLQCLEMLLKAGATTEFYESELPDTPRLREKIVALMQQYHVPILSDKEDNEEYEEEDDEEEAEEEEAEEEYDE